MTYTCPFKQLSSNNLKNTIALSNVNCLYDGPMITKGE